MNIYNMYNSYIDYLSVNRLKETTILNIKRKITNHILPILGKKDIYNINELDILEWQKYVITLGYSTSFEKNIQSIMLGFFNYLEKFYNVKNVVKIVGNFKSYNVEEKKELNVWSIKEYKKFIKSVDDKVYHALFNILFMTGIRKGEALALKFSDIDNKFKYIKINYTLTKEYINGERKRTKPKSKNSIRKIRIDWKLRIELYFLRKYYIKKYNYFNNNFYIFGGITPIATTTLDRKKNYYCDLAKVKKIRIHDFRHSHATILYHKNIKIKSIQERLGHADISTTLNTYVHTDIKDEKKVLRTLSILRLKF